MYVLSIWFGSNTLPYICLKELSTCGECLDCMRPDCGECGPCLDILICGHATEVCELKHCQFMRYADPEVCQGKTTSGPKNHIGTTSTKSHSKNARRGKKRAKHPKQHNYCGPTRTHKKKKTTNSRAKKSNDNLISSPFKDLNSPHQRVGSLKILCLHLGEEKKKVSGHMILSKMVLTIALE